MKIVRTVNVVSYTENVSRKLFTRDTRISDTIKILLQKYFCPALHTKFIHRSIPPDKINISQIRKVIH